MAVVEMESVWEASSLIHAFTIQQSPAGIYSSSVTLGQTAIAWYMVLLKLSRFTSSGAGLWFGRKVSKCSPIQHTVSAVKSIYERETLTTNS